MVTNDLRPECDDLLEPDEGGRSEDSADLDAEDPDEDIVMDAEEIEILLRQNDQARMEIGKYLACRYYSNSRREFQDHRTKDFSLRKLVDILAKRGKVKASKSTLSNCAAVYFQKEDIGEDQARQLSFGVQVALLREKDLAKKKALARQAIDEHLTVRDLQAQITGKKTRKPSALKKFKKAAEIILGIAEDGLDVGDDEAEEREAAIGMLRCAISLLEPDK